jgi:hypothetical protein
MRVPSFSFNVVRIDGDKSALRFVTNTDCVAITVFHEQKRLFPTIESVVGFRLKMQLLMEFGVPKMDANDRPNIEVSHWPSCSAFLNSFPGRA